MSGALRVAIVGVGRIGRMHARLVAGDVPGTELVAVHDVVPERARAAAEQLGVRAALSLEDVLDDPSVDAVGICASTSEHADLAIAAARAGKAIFCEKPISLDLAEVDRVLTAVDDAGVPFQVGFNRRFDATHAAVRAAVARGAIGDPHLIRITSRDPVSPPLDYVRDSGGIFLDMTIHDFDMARFVARSEIVEVYANGARRIDPSFAEVDDYDTVVVTLRHASGCLTAIDNSRQAAYGYDQRVEVFGSEGMACSDNPLRNASVLLTREGVARPQLSDFFIDRYAGSFVEEWARFADAVRGGVPTAVTGADARVPLVAGLAAIRSIREQRPVAVAEVDA